MLHDDFPVLFHSAGVHQFVFLGCVGLVLVLAQMIRGAHTASFCNSCANPIAREQNNMSLPAKDVASDTEHEHKKVATWRGQDRLLGLKWAEPMPAIPSTPQPPQKKAKTAAWAEGHVPQEWSQVSQSSCMSSGEHKVMASPESPMKLPNTTKVSTPTSGTSSGMHAYAVWWHPICDTGFDYRGVHAGGTNAWNYIQTWLPKGQYEGSKVRLRRFPDVTAAMEGYTKECRQHKAPDMPKLWKH